MDDLKRKSQPTQVEVFMETYRLPTQEERDECWERYERELRMQGGHLFSPESRVQAKVDEAFTPNYVKTWY